MLLLNLKMATRNLSKQKKQTLFSIIGGSIGTALIVAAYVFFTSFNYSGSEWLKAHFGNIEWQLNPTSQKSTFSSKDIAVISKELEPHNLNLLSNVNAVFSATKYDQANSRTDPNLAEINILGVGFDFEKAALFEPDQPLWRTTISKDEVIISTVVANKLQVVSGDYIKVYSEHVPSGNPKGRYKVLAVTEELGITGFRGVQQATGTMIFNLGAIQEMVSVSKNDYQAIWVNSPLASGQEAFITSSDLYTSINLKSDSLNVISSMKSRYGISFVFASSIAILSGALLLLQILYMLADTRQEMYGVLRAIGLSSKRIGRIFFTEATLLIALTSIVGALFGSFAGYFLIKIVSSGYTSIFARYEGFSIPIKPYINIIGVILTSLLVFILLELITLYVTRKVKKMTIMELIHGKSKHVKQRNYSYSLIWISSIIVAIFIVGLATGKALEYLKPQGMGIPLKSFLVILLWICSSFGLLYISFSLLPQFRRLIMSIFQILRFSKIATLLGIKYSQLNFKRSFTVSLLFSVLFMSLTTTVIVSSHMFKQNEVNEEKKSLLGFSAFIPYENKNERELILNSISESPFLRGAVQHPVVMESYKLNVDSQLLNSNGIMSVLAANEIYKQYGNSKLTSRLSDYKSDEEVWNDLLVNDEVIILDKKYSLPPEEWSGIWANQGLPKKQIKVGDILPLTILEKTEGLRAERGAGKARPLDNINLKIIGFVDGKADQVFYNLAFVSPKLYEKYKPAGYKWPNESMGYTLFNFDHSNLELINNLRLQFLSNNVTNLQVPEEMNTVDQLLNRQMILIYLSFMTFSLLIGIAGLGIIQTRSIQERVSQIKTLRFIGLRKRVIVQMFLVEGTVIGWIGLLNGLVFGICGSYLITKFVEVYIKPTSTLVSFEVPLVLLLVLSAVLMIVILLLNLLASRQAGHIQEKKSVNVGIN